MKKECDHRYGTTNFLIGNRCLQCGLLSPSTMAVLLKDIYPKNILMEETIEQQKKDNKTLSAAVDLMIKESKIERLDYYISKEIKPYDDYSLNCSRFFATQAMLNVLAEIIEFQALKIEKLEQKIYFDMSFGKPSPPLFE